MLSDIPWNVILMQLFFGLALGSIFVLLASGLSIIYGLLDVVNFAHGTFAMLGAYVGFRRRQPLRQLRRRHRERRRHRRAHRGCSSSCSF